MRVYGLAHLLIKTKNRFTVYQTTVLRITTSRSRETQMILKITTMRLIILRMLRNTMKIVVLTIRKL